MLWVLWIFKNINSSNSWTRYIFPFLHYLQISSKFYSFQSLGLPSWLSLFQYFYFIKFSSVQSLSRVWLFVTPWTAACQASRSITNSWSLLRLMSIESVMPANHLILCHPLLHPPSVFHSIRVFSNESVLCIRWPKYKILEFQFQPQSFQWIFRTDLV